jgi:hypothetical protein
MLAAGQCALLAQWVYQTLGCPLAKGLLEAKRLLARFVRPKASAEITKAHIPVEAVV